MKLRTFYRVLNWFETYQGDESREKMVKLYKNLVLEEHKELMDAIRDQDAVEVLDAIWDILWVELWLIYFSNPWIKYYKYGDPAYTDIALKVEDAYERIAVNFDIIDKNKVFEILDDLVNEIANSNYTKTKLKQQSWEKEGKIIKWPNFKKPDIGKIIKKYNLQLKDLEDEDKD